MNEPMPDDLHDIDELLEELSGQELGAAAGTAACLCGAMGAALLLKLVRIILPGDLETQAKLEQIKERLRALAAFDAVATKHWKCNPPELITIPQEAAEQCEQAIQLGELLIKETMHPVGADGRAGLSLLRSARDIVTELVNQNLTQNTKYQTGREARRRSHFSSSTTP